MGGGERVEIAQFHILGFHARPLGACAQKPPPLPDYMGRVKCVSRNQQLHALAARHAIVKDVRGAGLMWGLELTRDAAPVVPAALERGVIVNRTAERVVRLLPPLIITEAEVDEGLGRLDAALGAVGAQG